MVLTNYDWFKTRKKCNTASWGKNVYSNSCITSIFFAFHGFNSWYYGLYPFLFPFACEGPS
jgi:hypothetical protein